MILHNFFLILYFAYACQAGFLIVVATEVLDVVGTVAADAAAEALLGSGVSEAFGVAASEMWFYDAVIVDGALYYGSNAIGAGVLAVGSKFRISVFILDAMKLIV